MLIPDMLLSKSDAVLFFLLFLHFHLKMVKVIFSSKQSSLGQVMVSKTTAVLDIRNLGDMYS